MPFPVNIFTFLNGSILLDVRSPLEFNSGHIPHAVNLPLFTDEERKIVGTLYKQTGKDAAILKGLEIVGPKLKHIVLEVKKHSKGREISVYCWRGGMRSGSMVWLLKTAGFKVNLLKGGYKSFRKYTLEIFSNTYNLMIIGGKTGSGKTMVLEELIRAGEQIINLEKLASHKGSSFGSLGEASQPTQEQFENLLAFELSKLDRMKTIWVEDESRLVGNKVIPEQFWIQMRNAKVIYLDIPFEQRVQYLLNEYGKFTSENLKEAINRITKRLGGLSAKTALEAIDNSDLKTACEISLQYYDKSYDHGVSKRAPESITKVKFEKLDFKNIANAIKENAERSEFV